LTPDIGLLFRNAGLHACCLDAMQRCRLGTLSNLDFAAEKPAFASGHMRGVLQAQHGALQSACVLLTNGLQAKIGDVGVAQLADQILQHDEEHSREPFTTLSVHLSVAELRADRSLTYSVISVPVPGGAALKTEAWLYSKFRTPQLHAPSVLCFAT
jgi:hypothetical protein